jgi:hypothetical protein
MIETMLNVPVMLAINRKIIGTEDVATVMKYTPVSAMESVTIIQANVFATMVVYKLI